MTPSRVVVAVSALAAAAGPTVLLWAPALPAAEIVGTSVTPFVLTPVAAIAPALRAPLFDVTRAPPPPPELAAKKTEAPAAPPPPLPVLVGAIVAPSGGLALVRKVDGSTAVVRSGETIDGWRLLSVRDGRALFELGDRREEVALDFKNKVSVAPTSEPTPSPPPTTSKSLPIAQPVVAPDSDPPH